jgi:hypothetical protein
MKPIITGVLASIAALGLLSACGSDAKLTVPTNVTVPAGITLPTGITLPDGVSIPDSLPQATVDLFLAQLEASGMKIDKACFTALLNDGSLRKLVAGGGTPAPETIAKFVSCIKQ